MRIGQTALPDLTAKHAKILQKNCAYPFRIFPAESEFFLCFFAVQHTAEYVRNTYA